MNKPTQELKEAIDKIGQTPIEDLDSPTIWLLARRLTAYAEQLQESKNTINILDMCQGTQSRY